MGKMTRKEYCEWLNAHKNKEEKEACSVIDAVLRSHLLNIRNEYDILFEPRKIIVLDEDGEKRRIEFDLVIYFITKPYVKRKNIITIGVEFKEYALQKVIWQAIRRIGFVDYMYIATRHIPLPPLESTVMAFAGIGWIVWSDDADKAFIVMRAGEKYSTYRTEDWTIYALVNYRLNRIIDMSIGDSLAKKKIKTKTLYDYVGDRDGK